MGACSSIPEESLRSKYSIKNRVGIGSFSVVKKGIRREDKREFAVKIVDKKSLDTNEIKMIEQEARILSEVCHPHVVKLEEVYHTPTKLYLILNYLKGGSLLEHINKRGQFSELNASGIVRDVANALDYLHKKGIAHRDVKPENLMFENDTDPSSIKLTDFGLAAYITPGQPMNTICGSPSYIAPEILDGCSYGVGVDMWSLGVLLYIMLCGMPPFHGPDLKQLFQSIRDGVVNYPDPFWGPISAGAKDLVSKLLVVDPEQRYTAEQVLQHPFVMNRSVVSGKAFDKAHSRRLSALGHSWKTTDDFLTKYNAQNKTA